MKAFHIKTRIRRLGSHPGGLGKMQWWVWVVTRPRSGLEQG